MDLGFKAEIDFGHTHIAPESGQFINLDNAISNTGYKHDKLLITCTFKKERFGSSLQGDYKQWLTKVIGDLRTAFEC